MLVGFTLTATLVLAGSLVWIAVSDLRTHQIPDLATVLIASIGMAQIVLGFVPSPLITLVLSALILIGLGWLSGLYWNRHGREALGLGDVKLLAAGTLVVGAERFWLMLLLASTGGLVAALLARRKRQDGIPFGPFIAYAILVTFMTSGPVP